MESNEFFYSRFSDEIDTICFNCHKPIKGKVSNFPYFSPINYDPRFDTDEEDSVSEYDAKSKFYFCSWDCKYETTTKLRGVEGEWQEREGYDKNGGVYGYIYHIYNRKTNMHYIGQTKYMPFFRWQEHVKSQLKGDICDLIFETITKVKVQSNQYLNQIEAWWIQKFIDDYGRDHVMNISVPQITVEHLVKLYKTRLENKNTSIGGIQ
jgi:hypothetical protein